MNYERYIMLFVLTLFICSVNGRSVVNFNQGIKKVDTIKYFFSPDLQFYFQRKPICKNELFAMMEIEFLSQKGIRLRRFKLASFFRSFIEGLTAGLVAYPFMAAVTNSDLKAGPCILAGGIFLAQLNIAQHQDDNLIALVNSYNDYLRSKASLLIKVTI